MAEVPFVVAIAVMGADLAEQALSFSTRGQGRSARRFTTLNEDGPYCIHQEVSASVFWGRECVGCYRNMMGKRKHFTRLPLRA